MGRGKGGDGGEGGGTYFVSAATSCSFALFILVESSSYSCYPPFFFFFLLSLSLSLFTQTKNQDVILSLFFFLFFFFTPSHLS